MKQMSHAEETLYVYDVMLKDFRESTKLAFEIMNDGQLAMFRKRAFEVIHFFEQQTDPELWDQLKNIIDPDTVVPDPLTGQVDPLAVRSLAETWLERWQNLNAAVGKKEAVA